MAGTFQFNSTYEGAVTGKLCYGAYDNNGNIYIEIFGLTKAEPYFQPWTTLSVNIEPLPKNHFAYDANNNGGMNDIIKVLTKLGLVRMVNGHVLYSGRCAYPVYRVTKKFYEFAEPMPF